MELEKRCQQCGRWFPKPYQHSIKTWETRTKYCSKQCFNKSKIGKKRPEKDKEKIRDTMKAMSRPDWHRMKRTRFYNIWSDMKSRCNNKNKKYYCNYGERGIKVCKEWLEFEGFRDDMYISYLNHVQEFGEKQTTIDRINNDLGYSFNNCRWATRLEQGRNRRNVLLSTSENN